MSSNAHVILPAKEIRVHHVWVNCVEVSCACELQLGIADAKQAALTLTVWLAGSMCFVMNI